LPHCARAPTADIVAIWIAAAIGIAILIGYVNLWDASERAKLTPDQIVMRDAEDRREAAIW
jgi:hypothetical protein